MSVLRLALDPRGAEPNWIVRVLVGTVFFVEGALVAIATTKLPMLMAKGLWPTVHEARTDWSMLLGLVFSSRQAPAHAPTTRSLPPATADHR